MAAVRVFVSYSHDSDPHKAWVLKLATDLRAASVDASLDQWDLAPGQDTSVFMQRGISESDRVVLVWYGELREEGGGRLRWRRLRAPHRDCGARREHRYEEVHPGRPQQQPEGEGPEVSRAPALHRLLRGRSVRGEA